MADKISKEARSKNMAAIKSVSKLEDRISKALWRKGLRFRRNTKDLFGKPDFSIKKYKVVIFIDSCFWHRCPIHGNMPKTNQEFWEKKLNRNVERDKEVTRYYENKDWRILRLWEHEFKEDFEGAVESIFKFINGIPK
jgi:DNA mismatch endonuclease (patch repair protein)